MLHTQSRLLRTVGIVLLVAAILAVAIPSAMALNDYLKTWEDNYPGSATSEAGCSTCHAGSTSTLNAYGRDLCLAFLDNGGIPNDIVPMLTDLESLDSDRVGGTNLQEILAGAQPGWTSGLNPVYFAMDQNCNPTGGSIYPPSDVPVPYDPPANGEPVADPGDPYTGYVNVPVTFDGSGSYDSDGGSLSYAWDFGGGATGTGMTPQHTYTVPGIYTVKLTVTDDKGQTDTNETTATISGDAVLDLDIASFSVTSSVRVGKSVAIKLGVNNPGPILGQSLATVVGEMNGVEVYRWRLNVYDTPGGKPTAFAFPAHKATTKGTINWTVTIADVDPDTDVATAKTIVK